MTRLENGVYTEIPDFEKTPEHLRRKRAAIAGLRARAYELAEKSRIEHEAAEKAIMEIRATHVYVPGKGYVHISKI